MNEVVLGIDIGTSSVKTIAVNIQGDVVASASESLNIYHDYPGYSEQDPDEWVRATEAALTQLSEHLAQQHLTVQGISFSGQMHSLVLLDNNDQPLRRAILWNDTRSSAQCRQIIRQLGYHVLGNPVLEGFTLTKLMWVQQHEPEIMEQAKVFLLPKDYVRFKLTGQMHMEYSDASSTLLLNPETYHWEKRIGEQFDIPDIYPPLVSSMSYIGDLLPQYQTLLKTDQSVAVFAGGGDNACGALGAGVVNNGDALCSIGTSGVVLACEADDESPDYYERNIHLFKHAIPTYSYAMGVTLAAGDSLQWLKQQMFPSQSFDDMIKLAQQSTIGARGLLFTPYLSGERTPHGDATIRGSFIGLGSQHQAADMVRAVVEGITYSLYESIAYLRQQGKDIHQIIGIGGGAKSDFWLQLQADIFNADIHKLKHEEGPSMGAAMIAACGLNWFSSVNECVAQFIQTETVFKPNTQLHEQYQAYFKVYQQAYQQTQPLTSQLLNLYQTYHN